MDVLGYTKESFASMIVEAMNSADEVIKGMNMPYDMVFRGMKKERGGSDFIYK